MQKRGGTSSMQLDTLGRLPLGQSRGQITIFIIIAILIIAGVLVYLFFRGIIG